MMGTLCHEAVSSEAAYGRLNDQQQQAVDIAREYVQGDGWVFEQQLELIDASGEIITAGTPDAFRVSGDEASLIDFKFGWDPPMGTESHYQLGAYAAMIAQVSGVSRVTARIIAPNSRQVESDSYAFTDFDAIAETIKSISRKCIIHPFHFQQGSWCRYCKGKADCPVFVNATDVIHRADDPVITADNAADWWDLCDAVDDRVKAIRSIIQAHFDANGSLPGFTTKNGRRTRTLPDVGSVWKQAKACGIKPEDFMAAVKITVSAAEKIFVDAYIKQGVAKTKADAKEIFNNELSFVDMISSSKMVRVKE